MAKDKPTKGTKKEKESFNPFPRLGTHTALAHEAPPPGAAPRADTVHPGELLETELQIVPPLPRVEVALRLQFRCSVALHAGDEVLVSLPGFKGPPAPFSLEARPHPEGLNTASYFRAYWTGETKLKGVAKLKGVPPKQTMLLRCVQELAEDTLVRVGVPLSLGLTSPDKLVANSPKLKLEANARQAENGKIARQAIATSSEIRKQTIAEELDIYARLIVRTAEEANIRKEDQYVAEELTQEELDQVCMAARVPLPYSLGMPFAYTRRAFHAYEELGGFMKCVMEAAVLHVKKHDHLALHREVAANWGLKVGALVALEDTLALRCAGLYPGIRRGALLACHLVTMEPVDVVRTFGIAQPPANAIGQELRSAFRAYDVLVGQEVREHEAALKAAAGGFANVHSGSNNADMMEPFIPEVYSERSTALVHKWCSLIAILFTASMVTTLPPVVEDNESPPPADPGLLRAPERLWVGQRHLPADELEHLQQMMDKDWYMFPSFVVATESFPPLEAKPAAAAGEGGAALPTAAALLAAYNAAKGGTPAEGAEGEEKEDDDYGDYIPAENAVVFELLRVSEALELADLSRYPNNREWLLPFAPSFRVVSVTHLKHMQRLTHVVLEMVGSMSGTIGDSLIPIGDRNIASMVRKKIQLAAEQGDTYTPALAQIALLNTTLQTRRRLHPPTLMRAQYLTHYQTVQHATAANQSIEKGTVVWQVCVKPPQLLEGVVRPAVWEAIPAKIAPTVELFFLERNKARLDAGGGHAHPQPGGRHHRLRRPRAAAGAAPTGQLRHAGAAAARAGLLRDADAGHPRGARCEDTHHASEGRYRAGRRRRGEEGRAGEEGGKEG
ncbi:hypothetical protein STCU_09486 [Strigomonas culicis]|uniref:Uncharacterized protein n=1 Tax=Strigomonas culicis TaxID=28005 RepID=S9TS26_9TRYP|nr:hypothetical protein STCU_09486 [Strigomonas culicis]|eukprot:EPY19389.1 hypothetical protein STCU_09486 [Strigomonas culicis]